MHPRGGAKSPRLIALNCSTFVEVLTKLFAFPAERTRRKDSARGNILQMPIESLTTFPIFRKSLRKIKSSSGVFAQN
jgi:hypothetical protein